MNFKAVLPENLSLLSQESIYFVGIKGVGMASLAVLLAQAGVHVTGADTEEIFVTDAMLSKEGIVIQSFSASSIPESVSVVIYSGAHKGRANPLVVDAQKNGRITLSLAQALGVLTLEKKTLAVCGVGGKSTTSSLLAWILERAGMNPSFSVGVGTIPNLGTSGRWSNGEFFCIEADEYVADPIADITPRFLYTQPTHIIATSLSFDHPDVYASIDDTRQAFKTYFAKRPADGWLIYNGDDLELLAVEKTGKMISVGEGSENDVQLTEFQVQHGIGSVVLRAPGQSFDGWQLASIVPGKHNLRNAAYAAVLASLLGADQDSILHAVSGFRSTPRRFEYKGTTSAGMVCYDDYAHHPRELQAIIETLQSWFPDKTPVIAFQPHTFSRTKALFEEFCDVLTQTSGPVFLLPIFASAREALDETISSQHLENELEKRGIPATILPNIQTLGETFEEYDDRYVCITLGAGDIYKAYSYVNFQ